MSVNISDCHFTNEPGPSAEVVDAVGRIADAAQSLGDALLEAAKKLPPTHGPESLLRIEGVTASPQPWRGEGFYPPVAPAADSDRENMVPQPVQQQQAQASSFDPLCPVMDAAYFERMALKMADPAWPNTARLIAEAEVEIRESVARRAPELLAAAATLGIDAPLALTGRYSADPIPAPATAIDRAYADINALGGYVDRKDPEAVARDELLGEILTILERHGARDLPAALLQIAA